MIKEAYCSFEVSKLLKEKGFREATQLVWYEHLPSQNAVCNSEIGRPKRDYFYWEREGEHNSSWTNNSPIPSYISGEVYSCPTHQMAMKWMREEKYIIIFVEPAKNELGNLTFLADVWTWNDEEGLYEATWAIDNYVYEEAVEAALKYSLENLINHEKLYRFRAKQ